jgi:hypothetical protein
MFEHLRRSWQSLLDGSLPPDERREVVTRMKETLVQAKVGVGAMREAQIEVRARLDRERTELATCTRRKQLAQQIGDAETVTVAEKFERYHQERCAVLERKCEVQDAELALAEREVSEMTLELKYAASGARPPGANYTGAFGAPSNAGTPASDTSPGSGSSGGSAAPQSQPGAQTGNPASRPNAPPSGAAPSSPPGAPKAPSSDSSSHAAELDAELRLAALKRRMGK